MDSLSHPDQNKHITTMPICQESKLNIAIIGAGFTGLTAAYELSKKGHTVTVFEKNNFAGGLASGIKNVVDDYPVDWEWDLERFYHHWFTNDGSIKKLIKEIGQEKKLIIKRPITSILYQGKIYQFDSAMNVLTFPHFSWFEKIRTGLALAELKFIPSWKRLEKISAHEWWSKKMGQRAYSILWEPLLKGKFDEFYKEINMAWFWARVHKRTPSLMYYQGGFGQLVDDLTTAIKNYGGEIRFNQQLETLPSGFDKTIVTVPPPIFAKLAPSLPEDYQLQLKALRGVGVVVLVLVLDKPLLKKVYWLNINEKDYPFVFVGEHTNFIPPEYYGGKHIIYVGNYLCPNHPDMFASKEELLEKFRPYLVKLNQQFNNLTIQQSWLFKEPFAQPIVGFDHSQKILPFKTPLPGVYLASMSQVYPWDRGTNYAVELGQKVTQEVLKDNV